MKIIILAVLAFHKKIISPILMQVFGGGCKFTPTCSEYAMKSIENYGMCEGGALAIKRVFRCNPFTKGGNDPVPEMN